MVESQSKLEAAFLAGRADATAERTGALPEGTEQLLRMVLFHASGTASALRVTPPVTTLPLVIGNGGSNGDHGRGR